MTGSIMTSKTPSIFEFDYDRVYGKIFKEQYWTMPTKVARELLHGGNVIYI